jgi:hypothetical protein
MSSATVVEEVGEDAAVTLPTQLASAGVVTSPEDDDIDGTPLIERDDLPSASTPPTVRAASRTTSARQLTRELDALLHQRFDDVDPVSPNAPPAVRLMDTADAVWAATRMAPSQFMDEARAGELEQRAYAMALAQKDGEGTVAQEDVGGVSSVSVGQEKHKHVHHAHHHHHRHPHVSKKNSNRVVRFREDDPSEAPPPVSSPIQPQQHKERRDRRRVRDQPE